MRYTGGQPWLVNALGYEVTFEIKENRDRSITITPEMLEVAKEQLILSRATHLDQLADKLKEERVRRVIEPLLLGESADVNDDDIDYALDLGLIKKDYKCISIANDIYQEVLPRELTRNMQDNFLYEFRPVWLLDNGKINTEKLLTMFQQFWRENSEIWGEKLAGYHEAAPHLTFQAFLQRVANGNGFIEREYGLGRGRADLMLKWKYPDGEQRIVIELKMLRERDTYDKIKADALQQTAAYADRCNADETHIVIFDRAGKTGWKEKVFTETCEHDGRQIKIWGL
jgi:hypothetical protein